ELAQTHADSWCRCLGGVQYFFRYDWSDGTFRTTATDLPDAALAWARDTIAAYARSLPPSNGSRPTTFGSPDGRSGPFTELAVLLTNDSYGMIFGEPPIPKRVARGSAAKVKEATATPEAGQLLVIAVVRESDGTPIVIYGYATDPRPFLAPTFRL